MPLWFGDIFGGGGGGAGAPEPPAFSPADLFAGSPTPAGAWWDPSDLTTLWSDDSRTTQSVVGGAVAVMDDKSGNGLHMRQTTANQRPILRQSGDLYYLEFDGSNDHMAVSFGTTYSQPNYYCCGFGQRSDTSNSDPVFDGISGSARNLFGRPGGGISGSWNLYAGTLVTGGTFSLNAHVGTSVFEGASSRLRIDGAEETLSGSPGTQGVTGLRIGADVTPGEFSALNFYGLVFTDASFLASLDDLESWMADKAGVTL